MVLVLILEVMVAVVQRFVMCIILYRKYSILQCGIFSVGKDQQIYNFGDLIGSPTRRILKSAYLMHAIDSLPVNICCVSCFFHRVSDL